MAGTWHGVSYSTIVTAAAVCGGISLAVGIALQAGVFHKFQKTTPGTWRTENPIRYLMSAASRGLVGVGFPLLYIYTGMGAADAVRTGWLMIGLKFGFFVFLAATLPLILALSTFANFHRGFVVGLLLDWALVCPACGVACAKLLQF